MKMHSLLFAICLCGFAFGDNTTVGESSDITNTGISLEADTLGQANNWGEWSMWSKWSSCSRNCDGGIAHQQRRCRRKPCRGRSFRYKICNPMTCKDPIDFRAEQCAAFNDVPYSGQLLKWAPHYDPIRPCALICRGEQSQNEESYRGKTGKLGDENISESDDTIVVQLADKVKDGTRCRPGSSDICISGECMKVGCDLRIGSNKKTDVCGVCGGDGSSCQTARHVWALVPISVCSKTCAGGFKMAMVVCRRQGTDEDVAESLCDPIDKPDKTLMPCNTHPCPPQWTTGEWGECSSSCGGGSRSRDVFCTEETGNDTTDQVNFLPPRLPENECSGSHKPRHQETCNTISCPMWETDEWSGCSVSCGTGVRSRTVECRDGKGRMSSDCEILERPQVEQECRTGVACPIGHQDDEELTQPLMQPYPPPPLPEKLISQPVPSESTFIADEWSPCSVTCGEGVRQREVHCKIFLEFSRTIAKLPDRQCSGPKPVETERCSMKLCGLMGNSLSYRMDTVGDSGYAESGLTDAYRSSSGSSGSSYEGSVKVAPGSSAQTTYSWKEAGYTHCSASCLGGVQDLIITCERDSDGKVVTPYLCEKETRPESRVRTCNDHPCPPRWNYSDFAPCMSPCGIGIQTRDVTCIHEVTLGGTNTVIVPNNMCPQPPPVDRQYCNIWDCPVKWHVEEWGKCSKTCGGGVKRRRVTCEQVMAMGHKQSRPESSCPPQKPSSQKPCNTRACYDMDPGEQPIILSDNNSFSQADPNKKVDLKIGGSAMVFQGTSVVKIRCPVKKFDRTQIMWTKNHNELRKSKKFKISRKGALRIIDVSFPDSGTYACIAGQTQAELHLHIKGRPAEYMSSEEILRHGNTVHQDANLDSAPANSGENLYTDHAARAYENPFALGSEDLSHEARGLVTIRPTKQPRRRKPKPSPSPPNATMVREEYTVTSLHQPGYQESVESTAPSSASRLMPHLNHLISKLKAYWPFQGDTTGGRGHRMAPLLPEDLRKDNLPTTRTFHDRNVETAYHRTPSDFGILRRNPGIPDEKFGPDEERIIIDDDPYDLDEAIFALQNAETVQSTSEMVTERRKQIAPTKSSIDYIEESLRNMKRQEQDTRNYYGNQRQVASIDFAKEVELAKKENREADTFYTEEPLRNAKRHGQGTKNDFQNKVQTTPEDIAKEVDFAKQDVYEEVNSNERISEKEGTTKMPDSNSESTFHTQSSVDDSGKSLKEESKKHDDNIIIQSDVDNFDPDSVRVNTNESEITENGKFTPEEVQAFDTLVKDLSDNSNSVPQHTTEDLKILDEVTEKPREPFKEPANPEETEVLSKNYGSTKTWEILTSSGFENGSGEDESTMGPPVILGKGTAEDLKFEWVTTEWSKCSQTCGGGGFQMRGAQCTVRSVKPILNSTQISPKTVVGAPLCEDAGYPVPQKVRPCGGGRCPQWHTGKWSPCETSRCFNWKTAMQRRDVSCRLVEDLVNGTQNITILAPSKCEEGRRPPQRQECYNDACKGVWRVGNWSECTASCEEDGIKYRILQCVWYGTRKPAGNACRDMLRPSVMKTCAGPQCSQSPDECKDLSKFCSRVKTMNMCWVPLFEKQCCETCKSKLK